MKILINKLICIIILISFLTAAYPGSSGYAQPDVETIFDISGKELSSSYYDARYYPVADGVRIDSFYFSTKGALTAQKDGDSSVLKYFDKAAGEDTYITMYTNTGYEGVFTFSGKLYTNMASSDGNMNFALARFFVNYGPGGVNDGNYTITEQMNLMEAEKWYDFKLEVNLYKDKNNFKMEVSPEDMANSGETGFSVGGTLQKKVYGDTAFRGGRFDFDLNSKDTSKFVAFKDLKLTRSTYTGIPDSYLNGNKSDQSFKDGIYTTVGSGTGLLALAVYEDGRLVSLDASYTDGEPYERKLNAVIENGMEKTVKIFWFDEEGVPYSVCAEPEYDSSDDIRVYANYDFSGEKYFENSVSRYVSDGKLHLAASGVEGEGEFYRPRFGINALNPGRYIIFEADYSIPEDQESGHRVRLIGGYYNDQSGNLHQVDTYVALTSSGKIYSVRDKSSPLKTYGDISSTPTNVAIKIDLVDNTYDLYINRTLVREGDRFLQSNIMPGTEYKSRGFYIGHLSGDYDDPYSIGTLIVENIKIYEGTEFIDIGNKIPNVHQTDFSDITPGGESEIYQRPDYREIAKKTLSAPHPRIIINKEKVEEIKNSDDSYIKEWTNNVMQSANNDLSTQAYKYRIGSTGEVGDLPESMARMMNLGMAYLLTGDKSYSDRAYIEAQALYKIYTLIDTGADDTEENRDYWNSSSCLDVTEISFILSVCYDWMYDAWTQAQRQELFTQVSQRGIDNMYRTYFNMYMPSHTNSTWWKISNNQGSVCNGNAIITALAFMENDAYRCSRIVESGIRAIEIVLENFAPDGGWNESASYWAYTLKTFTMACASLDNICGTNYGLQNAPGLRNSCFYSLSIEGESGTMSYGDSGGGKVNAPFLFYWAKAYKDKSIGAAAMYMKEEMGFKGGIYDLIYYDANYIGDMELPQAFYYRGTEMVSFASGRGKGESYVVMLGGPGHGTGHDHLDSGSIIVEMNGERVFTDSGAEYYGAPGYFSTNRHLYFRARPEAHNIFIINPENTSEYNENGKKVDYCGQSKTAFSAVTDISLENKTATMDLSDAYARDAYSASRTIALNGKTLIVEDEISLKEESNVYWNWYVNVKNDKNDTSFTAGNIEISSDGKSAIVTRNDKRFSVSFETNADYTLSVEKADYYVNVDPDPGGVKHSNEPNRRLAVQFKGVSGTITVKTIVQNLQ